MGVWGGWGRGGGGVENKRSWTCRGLEDTEDQGKQILHPMAAYAESGGYGHGKIQAGKIIMDRDVFLLPGSSDGL